MIGLLKAKVTQYMVPIVIVSFIALAGLLAYTQYQYESTLEEKAKVEQSLVNTTAALALETEKLLNERKAALNLVDSLNNVEARYNSILEELKGAARDETGDITVDAAVSILCEAGLATPTACLGSTTGVITPASD